MATLTLKEGSLKLVDNYLNFSGGGEAKVSVPYYNNRRGGVRAGLRGQVGKGTINDISEEAAITALRERVVLSKVTAEEFKKFLVNNSIGIDCSGFVYHILNQESIERKKGSLKKHLSFPFAKNFIRKMISRIRSVEGAGVNTFAHNLNSKRISLTDIAPGDFVSMTYADPAQQSHNHIILVYQVDSENGIPVMIHYCHSIAWSTDGEYKHGVRLGEIKIIDPAKPITEQMWSENGKTGAENLTLQRALMADAAEIRRLNWF